jgi:hypothetical protein
VYYTNGSANLTMGLPANSAFYFYVEPNPFALIEFEITDGSATVVESISGSSGAAGYGFCGASKVGVRTTDGVTDFAVGEFGICRATIAQLGTLAPPRSLCGKTMTPFPADPRPTFGDETTVASPLGGNVTFSTPCSHRVIGGGWGSWSHGYTGDVYYTNGSANLTMGLPANSAFYFYVEPNPFALIEFEITDGSATVVECINGSSGAAGYGFCGASKVGVRTTDGVTDFAVGEFGIAN